MASSSSGPMSCPFHGATTMELRDFQKPYKCDGCEMMGSGPRYRCNHCDYELHSQCMYPSHKFSPRLLQGNIFEFKSNPVGSCSIPNCTVQHERNCDACAKAVNGFVYHCKKTGFDLHPCCATLDTEIVIEGVKIRLDNKGKMKNKCDWCDAKSLKGSTRGIRGWSYVSSDYNYHVSCIMEMAVQSWKLLPTISGEIDDQGGGGDHYYNSLALRKLDLPASIVKKKKTGSNGNKYWRILRLLLTTVLSLVFGDPTTLLAKVAVETVIQLLSS